MHLRLKSPVEKESKRSTENIQDIRAVLRRSSLKSLLKSVRKELSNMQLAECCLKIVYIKKACQKRKKSIIFMRLGDEEQLQLEFVCLRVKVLVLLTEGQ